MTSDDGQRPSDMPSAEHAVTAHWTQHLPPQPFCVC